MKVWFLGQEYLLEKERATHSSILAWRIPRTEEPGRLQSTGSQRFGHYWSDLACTHVYHLNSLQTITPKTLLYLLILLFY